MLFVHTCVSDINECARRQDSCSDFAVCSNTMGSFECTCLLGYQGDGRDCAGRNTDLKCEAYVIMYVHIHSADIDECASDRANCDVNADCINTRGSFQCICRSGYQGSGQVCTGM